MKTRTAIVLAGGLGTRLQSILPDTPKALAPVAGRPFIHYIFDYLAAQGIERFVLCVGHLASRMMNTLGDRYGEAELLYSVETEQLGTGGAVRDALCAVDDENVLVLNGDSFIRFSLALLEETHTRSKGCCTMVLTRVENPARFGTVSLTPQGAVRAFREKESGLTDQLVNAGVYLLSRSKLPALPKTNPLSLERQIFPAWIGHGLFGYEEGGSTLIDIGTPLALASAEEEIPRLWHDYGLAPASTRVTGSGEER